MTSIDWIILMFLFLAGFFIPHPSIAFGYGIIFSLIAAILIGSAEEDET